MLTLTASAASHVRIRGPAPNTTARKSSDSHSCPPKLGHELGQTSACSCCATTLGDFKNIEQNLRWGTPLAASASNNTPNHMAAKGLASLCLCRWATPRRQAPVSLSGGSPARTRYAIAAICRGARHCQSRNLGLKPWENLPLWIDDLAAALCEPFDDQTGTREAAELLKKMLAAELSKYEPDPIRAIAEAEAKAAP